MDRSASALFGLACGYAAYAWFAGPTQEPLLGLEAMAAFALAYMLSLRALTSIQPEPRKVPVPIFDVREVEPMHAVERPVLQRVRPAAERPTPEVEPATETPVVEEVGPACETPLAQETEEPIEGAIEQVEPTASEPTEPFEAFGAADSGELELSNPAETEIDNSEEQFVPESDRGELPQDSRVVHLFDPASMPTTEEMISRIDRHLQSQPSPAQSADAAQALHQALAELRRSIR